VRSIKEECLEQMIVFGEASLRNSIHSFVEHYHLERNHQGLENRLIAPLKAPTRLVGAVECRQRLGGLLKHYYREAA
jgi:putative transposase